MIFNFLVPWPPQHHIYKIHVHIRKQVLDEYCKQHNKTYRFGKINGKGNVM